MTLSESISPKPTIAQKKSFIKWSYTEIHRNLTNRAAVADTTRSLNTDGGEKDRRTN